MTTRERPFHITNVILTMSRAGLLAWRPFAVLLLLLAVTPALAQAPGGPPAVGVVTVQPASVTETSEFVGRVQAVQRVALTARVTAFMEQRLFVEGNEVRSGDLLYRLERGPFEADVSNKEAAVADNSAKLANATIQLNRAQTLLGTPAGQRSNVDDAVAAQRSRPRNSPERRRRCGNRGSIWTTRKSWRRSTARSAAPRSRRATSFRPIPDRWR
jgi:multidrug efflux pump subunit AcrA (membrane-fusion protein)